MTNKPNDLKNFPMSIMEDTILQKEVFFIQKNRFAVHGNLPSTLLKLPVLYKLEQEQIAVLVGNPEHMELDEESVICTPVYGRNENDLPAVPTGLIFIQLKEGQSIENKRKLLLSKGYLIHDIPHYAPHCAWLMSDQGKIADALNHLPALKQVPDVQSVKPQMLQPRSFK